MSKKRHIGNYDKEFKLMVVSMHYEGKQLLSYALTLNK